MFFAQLRSPMRVAQMASRCRPKKMQSHMAHHQQCKPVESLDSVNQLSDSIKMRTHLRQSLPAIRIMITSTLTMMAAIMVMMTMMLAVMTVTTLMVKVSAIAITWMISPRRPFELADQSANRREAKSHRAVQITWPYHQYPHPHRLRLYSPLVHPLLRSLPSLIVRIITSAALGPVAVLAFRRIRLSLVTFGVTRVRSRSGVPSLTVPPHSASAEISCATLRVTPMIDDLCARLVATVMHASDVRHMSNSMSHRSIRHEVRMSHERTFIRHRHLIR